MALSRDARRIDRVRRGDDSAFEQLHACHQPAILAFCRHLTGNREDAEDAVQHTFLAAYRRLADSAAETTDWRPWLFTVARNRCLTLLRMRREQPLVEPEPATSFDGLALEIERRQELRDLVGDMGRLPEPQRAALVLSQLDALSYREIGTVLDVAPEKVKALVFQARSSLASAREARDAPCFEIRHELATARGAALRRRMLRRHVGQCEGCRDFEVAMKRQRHDLGLLLPVAPSVGLGQAVLDAIGRDTSAAGSAGTAAVGGGAGAGLGGTLAAVGLPGVAKLAVVVAVLGGGTSGALAADLPERVGSAVPWHEADNGVAVEEQSIDPVVGSDEAAPGVGGPERLPAAPRGDHASGGDGLAQRDDERALAGVDEGPAPRAGDGEQSTPQPDSDDGGALPPGLAKRDELPPGLAKRGGELPPGLAKRGAAPGSKPGNGSGSTGNGNGNGGHGNGGSAGQGQGNGGGAQSGGQGNAGGNGTGNAGGNGGGSGGQGNAGGNGGAGQGQGGGSGQGNAGGNGNGGGNPH